MDITLKYVTFHGKTYINGFPLKQEKITGTNGKRTAHEGVKTPYSSV